MSIASNGAVPYQQGILPNMRKGRNPHSGDPQPPWYARHLCRHQPSGAWDRFKEAIAADIPNRSDDQPTKVRGRLDLGTGTPTDLQSGKAGPARRVEMPGKSRRNEHHVEAHAAATMRETGSMRGVLYLNKEPCRNSPDACRYALPRLLPEGARLVIYAPRMKYTYTGQPDPPTRQS